MTSFVENRGLKKRCYKIDHHEVLRSQLNLSVKKERSSSWSIRSKHFSISHWINRSKAGHSLTARKKEMARFDHWKERKERIGNASKKGNKARIR
jgi:hypothetical protein